MDMVNTFFTLLLRVQLQCIPLSWLHGMSKAAATVGDN